MAHTTYVLDTNVLLNDAQVLTKFQSSSIVIPFIVLEELDRQKGLNGMLGFSARSAVRAIEALSEKGDLLLGVKNGKKGKIFVAAWNDKTKEAMTTNSLEDTADNKILSTALSLRGEDQVIVLVSNDVALKIKGKSLGLKVISHKADERDDKEEVYSGIQEIFVDGFEIDAFYASGEMDPPKNKKFYENEYIHLVSNSSNSQTAVAKYEYGAIVKVDQHKSVCGVKPKNLEQICALDGLMGDLDLFILIGGAGCGKSYLSLAAAVDLVFNKNLFEKIMVVKPIVELGEPLGFLPGDVDSKIGSHYNNVEDSLLQLFPSYTDPKELMEYLKSTGKIEFTPITFMRGRSLKNLILIVEECQNFSKSEIRSLLTRVGENVRVFVSGDQSQCDASSLDSQNNGIVHVLEAFKQEECAGSIMLKKSERSAFSERAADLL